jgi:cobalt-zinc-cadmium resistance protein CzcA
MPIFSFQKVEGKCSLLGIYAWICLLGSLILSLTYVPAMCKLLLTKNIEEKENFISRFFRVNIYRVYEFSDRHKKGFIIGFVALLALCGWRFSNYGSEFLPKLNEGAIYVRATLPNSESG